MVIVLVYIVRILEPIRNSMKPVSIIINTYSAGQKELLKINAYSIVNVK